MNNKLQFYLYLVDVSLPEDWLIGRDETAVEFTGQDEVRLHQADPRGQHLSQVVLHCDWSITVTFKVQQYLFTQGEK